MCGAGHHRPGGGAPGRAGRRPGLAARFAFERWPSFDAERWERLRAAPATPRRARRGRIWAWDRDPKAIERVRGNAARAGLADALGLAVARLGGTPDVDPPAVLAELRAATGGAPGLIVVNPPYGSGWAARRRRPGWCGRWGGRCAPAFRAGGRRCCCPTRAGPARWG